MVQRKPGKLAELQTQPARSAARAADELTNEGSSRADVQNGNDMREKVAELMQMDVEPVPAAPAGAPMMNTAPEPATPVVNARETLSVQNSADEPGFESPSGRFLRRGDSASEGEDSVESPAESEPPLTDEELAAFAEMRPPEPGTDGAASGQRGSEAARGC